jgi:RNA polymerase sigma-70 factor (ECF subfamily)
MPDTEESLAGLTDEALARRIAGGPPGSTDAEEAELYRRFAPRVRFDGRRHLQHQAAADDLAQDVLLLTIARLHAGEVRRPEEIGSFIPGTSRMMARAERRVAQRRDVLAARFMHTATETAPSSTVAEPRDHLRAGVRQAVFHRRCGSRPGSGAPESSRDGSRR